MRRFRQHLQRLTSIVFSLVILCALHVSAHGQIQFSAPVTYKVGASADYPVAVDLDGDGNLDIAVANGQTITVLYGHGDGTFDPPVDYPVGATLEQIIAVDLNNDGKPDIAVTSSKNGTISIFWNQSPHTFNRSLHTPKPTGLSATFRAPLLIAMLSIILLIATLAVKPALLSAPFTVTP